MSTHWKRAWSQEAWAYYYYDTTTGESSWEKPANCLLADPEEDMSKGRRKHPSIKEHFEEMARQQEQKQAAEGLPRDWQAHLDPVSKRYYFYNAKTRTRTWLKPGETDGPDEDMGSEASFPMMTPMHAPENVMDFEDLEEMAKHQKVATEDLDANHALWDEKGFLERLGHLNDPRMRQLALMTIAPSNTDFASFKALAIPKTIAVSHKEIMKAIRERRVRMRAHKPVITMSTRTTASAIKFFAKDADRFVCALNFASGEKELVGGHYMTIQRLHEDLIDSDNQEEDLCRRLPALHPSLHKAADDGLYPFGPVTALAPTPEEAAERSKQTDGASFLPPAKHGKYMDVLFTSNGDFEEKHHKAHLISRDQSYVKEDDLPSAWTIGGMSVNRGPIEEGFPLLEDSELAPCSIVSAAPPITEDLVDPGLVQKMVETIFVAPILRTPECTTLILGAWGCGSRCAMKTEQMAEIFAKAIVCNIVDKIDTPICLGKLYCDIHFAIPETKPGDNKFEIFEQTLYKYGIDVTVC